MGTPFVGQCLLASFNFAPKGYALCNGQLLSISQNQPLFAILGTYYGGNGIQTFALPNLQGRAPIGYSDSIGVSIGQVGGAESVILTGQQVPSHTHSVSAGGTANAAKPTGALVAGGGPAIFNSITSQPGAMNAGTLANSGGSQGHENRQPFLVMNWCISLSGIFPSRN